MHFKDYLSKSSSLIHQNLDEVIDEVVNKNASQTPQLKYLVKKFTDHVYGGKVLRGTLSLLGYEMFGGKNRKQILKIASALEILHTALLVHDDVIDQSPTRRGKPSIYKALGGNHHGISQAICLGDFGLFCAISIINSSDFDSNLKNSAIQILIDASTDTILGEMLDVDLAQNGVRRLEKDVLIIHHLKTASYSFVAPFSIGAIFANCPTSKLEHINNYGINLGIAFQIQDDILGVFGDEEKLGKSTHSDIEEGKNTLLITYTLENGSKKQIEFIKKHYGVGKINQNDYLKILEIFRDVKALDYSKTKARNYILKAKVSIKYITEDKKMQELLNQLADLVVDRTK